MLLIFATLAGFVLGLHLDVLILISTTILGAGIFLAVSSFSAESWLGAAGHLSILVSCLQGGFFVGLTGRPLYAALLARIAQRATTRT